MFSDKDKQLAELIEAKVFFETLNSVPLKTKQILQLDMKKIENLFLFKCIGIPYLTFNRVMGLETSNVDKELFSTILKFFDYPNHLFGFQLPPEGLKRTKSTIERYIPSIKHKSNWIRFLQPISKIKDETSSLVVKRVKEKDRSSYSSIIANAYGWTGDVSSVVEGFLLNTNLINLLVFDDDTPIAAGSLYLDKESDICWLGGAATDKNHRKKGAQGLLVRERLRIAMDAGYRIATVETAEDNPENRNPSYHNMLRYGFSQIYERANLIFYPDKK